MSQPRRSATSIAPDHGSTLPRHSQEIFTAASGGPHANAP